MLGAEIFPWEERFMSRMTKKSFVWLATEIAPMLKEGTLDEFTRSVKAFAKNPRFKTQEFKDVAWSHWQEANKQRSLEELVDLDDHIPFLEDTNGSDKAAA